MDTDTIQDKDGITNQIIIYAKGWYGRGSNIITDIKKVMANFTGCDEKYFSEGDVFSILIATFEEFVPLHDRKQGLNEIFGFIASPSLIEPYKRKPEEIMVGIIGAAVKSEQFNILGQYNFSLDGKCYQYCPTHKGLKRNCGCECSCSICNSVKSKKQKAKSNNAVN